jgi:uncharacterized protein (UPF0212 family)
MTGAVTVTDIAFNHKPSIYVGLKIKSEHCPTACSSTAKSSILWAPEPVVGFLCSIAVSNFLLSKKAAVFTSSLP